MDHKCDCTGTGLLPEYIKTLQRITRVLIGQIVRDKYYLRSCMRISGEYKSCQLVNTLHGLKWTTKRRCVNHEFTWLYLCRRREFIFSEFFFSDTERSFHNFLYCSESVLGLILNFMKMNTR